jgi:putative membrane protein
MSLAVRILVAWLANAAALWLADRLFDGVEIEGWGPLLLAAAVLAVLSAIVKPILVLLAIPFIVLTLGLFLLVINLVVLWATAQLVGGFDITGFWTYVGTLIVVWLVNTIINSVVDTG